MEISELRDRISDLARDFAWSQWAQMGVSGSTSRMDRWAADPEALFLLTLEVGRDDPRLTDEVLDWFGTNERLLSVQRLRNLADDGDDSALVEAAIGWAAQWRPRPRLNAKPEPAASEPIPYFRRLGAPARDLDRGFLAAGFHKPLTRPSWKSQAPDFELPINFAFRMRSLLGIGARAEVARILVCSSSPSVSAQELAALAAFSKRNTQEALGGLRAAGVISSSPHSNEQRFEARRARWASLLGLDPAALPGLVDWPALFGAIRQILRWLSDPKTEDLSDYMRGSEARTLLESSGNKLIRGGITYSSSADPWQDLVGVIDELGRIFR
ncbi:MAG: hypothetical protein QOE75_707 [Solirubrobacterales bacterium]|jgi:hypothetical protein|nr:hypothetical protein [Solirubrobacterales bacterium]